MILLEGGNIWDDVETNWDPITVGKPLAGTTQKFINPLKTKLHIIGSVFAPRYDKDGKVVASNDLDSMIELADLMKVFGTPDAKTTRKALNDYLQKQGIQTKQAGVTVHTRIPMAGKFYQADIKVIPNAAKVAQFHRHEIPKGSPYKGVNKQMVMNALASSQNMLWSPDEGLYARDQAGKKAQLLSDDWDTIAQYLLGKGAKGNDLGSVESIMAKISDPKRKEEILNMARSSSSWQSATPGLMEFLDTGGGGDDDDDLKRQVIEMYFEDGLRETEISKITGLSEIAVNNIIDQYERGDFQIDEGEVVSMQARKTPLVIAGSPYDWNIYDLRTNQRVANILGGDRHERPMYEVRIKSSGMTSTKMPPTYVVTAGRNNNPPYYAYELVAPEGGFGKVEKSPGPGGTTKLRPDQDDMVRHLFKNLGGGKYYGYDLDLVEEGLNQYQLVEKALGAKIMDIDDAIELGYTDWDPNDSSSIVYLGNKNSKGSNKQVNEAPDVGRKYQHIEDLILSHGSHGGLHAVERLRDMATTGGSIELKWDGMPVVYWGRDEEGNFMMIPKNAWAYLKRGQQQTKSGAPTLTKSPQDVAKFIMGTGSGDPKQRMQFAKQFAMLWPYFEKISPKKGFIEGGLLFYPGTRPDGQTAMPVLNKETNTYDFQPNITQFHVPVDSDLGKKIAKAKVGVAATGYYPTIGSSDETRFPDAEKLSTPDVLVQGTTFVQDPVKLNTKMIDNVEKYIQSHAKQIDNYLAPKPGLSKPASEIYSYLNQHLRTTGLANDFPAWAKSNLSAKKADAMLADKQGMIATLGAIEGLSRQKTELINQLSQQAHGGIKQTKPEGYAQAHPGRKFKYDIPGQFIKVIDQPTWSPKESVLNENKGKKAVLGWGRGMGHTGHDALVNAVIHQAQNTNGTPFFIVSRSFGKDDPIPPEMKLQMYQKKFSKYKNIFSLPTADKPTLNDVLTDLGTKGYKDVDLVVGADQKDAFGYLLRPAKSTGVEPYKSFGLDSLNVMSRQDTKAPGSNPESPDYHEGPRATPMRQVLMDPNKSEEEQFAVWRQAMSPSLSDKEVLNMMNIAKNNLAQFNTPKAGRKMNNEPKGRKLKEYMEKIRNLMPTATPEQKQKLYELLSEAKKQYEAANPAQQAAIAISMKKAGKKPKKKVSETIDYLPEK